MDKLTCVPCYGIYSVKNVWVHEDCYDKVIRNPEIYGNAMVDRALHVAEIMEIHLLRVVENEARRKEKLAKAQSQLPTKPVMAEKKDRKLQL